jgi:hypothetical protein
MRHELLGCSASDVVRKGCQFAPDQLVKFAPIHDPGCTCAPDCRHRTWNLISGGFVFPSAVLTPRNMGNRQPSISISASSQDSSQKGDLGTYHGHPRIFFSAIASIFQKTPAVSGPKLWMGMVEATLNGRHVSQNPVDPTAVRSES